MMDGEYSVWKKYENVLLVRKNGRALNQGHSFFFLVAFVRCSSIPS